MNNWLWVHISALGWAYWVPAVILCAVNIAILAALDPPKTGFGRMARIFAWAAHLPMLFSPWMNALGMVALPLMIVANTMLYTQVLMACRKARGPTPNGAHWAERVLNTMVAKP